MDIFSPGRGRSLPEFGLVRQIDPAEFPELDVEPVVEAKEQVSGI
jgi:hypothetical protein